MEADDVEKREDSVKCCCRVCFTVPILTITTGILERCLITLRT